METPINDYNLKQLEDYVQPAGEFIVPPDFSSPIPVWKFEQDSGWLTLLLETAKALVAYDQMNGLGKLPDLVPLDEQNLRQITIEQREAFLDLIHRYAQEHPPESP